MAGVSQAIGNVWELIGHSEAYIEKTPQGLSAGKEPIRVLPSSNQAELLKLEIEDLCDFSRLRPIAGPVHGETLQPVFNFFCFESFKQRFRFFLCVTGAICVHGLIALPSSVGLPLSGGPVSVLVHYGSWRYSWGGRRSGSGWRSRPLDGLGSWRAIPQ